jgi:hypothetical protein
MYGAENLVSNYFFCGNTFILTGVTVFYWWKGQAREMIILAASFGAFSRLETAMHATCALAMATGWRVGLSGDVQMVLTGR